MPETKRVNLEVSLDLHAWLARARLTDRVSTSDRIRALLELAREDPQLGDRVIAKASQLAEKRAEQQL